MTEPAKPKRTRRKPVAEAPAPQLTPKPTRPSRRRAPKAEPTVAVASALEPALAPLPELESEPRRPRRVVLTGGAGFVGRHVAEALRNRGDTVVALVRDARRAGFLHDLGVELVESDLTDDAQLVEVFRDGDALIHAAGRYRIGISKAERGAMWEANIGTTTRVLDAAEAAGTPRVVYVSTANVFGNTRGRVVDESYRRNLGEGFLSWYDETKYGAHEVAEQRLKAGAPVIIVMPSQVYGPGDNSEFGEQLGLAADGRLRYSALDDVGVGLVHVEDLAAGILAAMDRGRVGQIYVLGGPRTTLRQAIELAASTAGRKAPALRVPSALLRAAAPLGRLIGQPNLREVVSASAGVTYWASAEKAERELGFRARSLEDGFRDTFGTRH